MSRRAVRKPDRAHELLAAIAKARSWLEELTADRTTIAEIDRLEGRGERHIRLLLPLAFVSPSFVGALADGTAPSSIPITELAQLLPNSWADQQCFFTR